MLRMRFYLTRPQLSWGVSARTRCTLYLRMKAPCAAQSVVDRDRPLVHRPGLALESLGVAAHARQGPKISIESFGISGRDCSATPSAGGAPARAAGPRARAYVELVLRVESSGHATHRSRANVRCS